MGSFDKTYNMMISDTARYVILAHFKSKFENYKNAKFEP